MTIPLLPTRSYRAQQMGSAFKGEYEYGFTIAFNPHGDFFFVESPTSPGGGGEWTIWQPPDFPGRRKGAWQRFNQPGFRRPSRTEKRGY